MRLIYLVFSFLLFACDNSNSQDLIDSKDVTKIEIENAINKQYIAHDLVFSNPDTISRIINEVNNLKEIGSVNLKASWGYFDMRIWFKNHRFRRFMINYTTYDGVVILGPDKEGIVMDRYYKNDKLELLVLWLFQPESVKY
jgi:hypothetical protein